METKSLKEIRRLRGLTQTQVAERSGLTQNKVSVLENESGDRYISTLRKLIEAMDGKLELVAVFPNRRVVISDW